MKKSTKASQVIKFKLLALACLFALTGYAQQFHNDENTDEAIVKEVRVKERSSRHSQDEIKTITKNGHHGAFIGVTFKATEFNNEPLVTAGVRMGFNFGRAIGLGFEGHGIIPSTKYSNIIQGESVYALGGYGGLFLEPIILSNKVMHLTFPVAGGAGWMGYHEDWENNFENAQLVDEDIYWYVEPGVNLELNVTRNFRLAFGVSQRFTQEFELVNTPIDAFNNRNYNVTLKFGTF